jgi:hypothetical protein
MLGFADADVHAMDPFLEPGRWLVTTASGARYLIDSRDVEHPVVTRVADTPADEEWRLVDLRRDGEALRVIKSSALVVGEPLVMVVEALGGDDWVAAVRHTTPVVSLERADIVA